MGVGRRRYARFLLDRELDRLALASSQSVAAGAATLICLGYLASRLLRLWLMVVAMQRQDCPVGWRGSAAELSGSTMRDGPPARDPCGAPVA